MSIITYESGMSSGYIFSIDFDTTASKILNVSVKRSSYSGVQPKGERGDHTTAVSTFRDMATNAVFRQSLDDGKANLKDLVKALSAFPTMQAPDASKMPGEQLVLATVNINDPKFDASFVPTIMDQLVVARNCMQHSAFPNKTSSGPGGEGAATQPLMSLQQAMFEVKNASYKLTEQDMRACWRLLDLRQPLLPD